MAKTIKKIAKQLGATIVSQVPETGGARSATSQLGRIVSQLQRRLRPSEGKRPGRPTDPSWVRSPKIPMSRETETKLAQLAERASTADRRSQPNAGRRPIARRRVVATANLAHRPHPRWRAERRPNTNPTRKRGKFGRRPCCCAFGSVWDLTRLTRIWNAAPHSQYGSISRKLNVCSWPNFWASPGFTAAAPCPAPAHPPAASR